MSGAFAGAAWVPGLPQLLQPEKSERWAELRRATVALADEIAKAKAEVLVLSSTQWISVLGVSYQAHPNPKGVHVDENWYELGDLPFDFKTDVQLAAQFAEATNRAGMPAKTVAYDEFPIDTGTIVALKLLNAKVKLPVAAVSSWVYADAVASRKIGQVMRDTVEESGKRAFFVASSLVSARFSTSDIDPASDHVSRPEDDADNRHWPGLVENGNLEAASRQLVDNGKRLPLDMQGNGFHWLTGALSPENAPGRILAYGPLWGTGAAVIHFSGKM